MKVIRLLVCILVSIALTQCTQNEKSDDTLIIAFGSCNNQDLAQPMWNEVLSTNPDVWVWLGDNIYGDSHDPEVLREKYRMVKSNPDYSKLREKTRVVGTWDDHDYGVNDGGKGNPIRSESQRAFLEFLDIPETDIRWEREGIYSAELIKTGDLMVNLIMLDARYFRDTIYREEGKYLPNVTGTVLGEEQWAWLEAELKQSAADVNIIGSGIQVLSEDHPYEKWANFPKERMRLIKLIHESGAKGVIFISGDRHIGEISEIKPDPLSYPLRDVTSSGLTHSYEDVGEEPNKLRISPLVNLKNFGMFKITKESNRTRVVSQLRGLNDSVFYETEWMY